jgi:hypothetical protein
MENSFSSELENHFREDVQYQPDETETNRKPIQDGLPHFIEACLCLDSLMLQGSSSHI